MKTFAVLGLSLLAAVAAADEEHRTVDASPDGIVTISNVAGSISVQGWAREQVDVTADLGRNVEELIVERDGNEVLVKVKLPRGNHRHSSGGSDLVVRVPERSSIKANGVSADITVNDVYGALRLQTVSGDVEADAFAADVDVETVSGDVEIAGDGKDMRARLSSVSGDIDASGLAGEIEAGSVSGDLTLVRGSFSRATLNTTNGDMILQAELRDDGRLDVETINGEVDIDFAGQVSARFDIETFNGRIDNCFGPQPERTSQYAPGRELIFNEGSGSGRVTIRTLNGDLRLCRD